MLIFSPIIICGNTRERENLNGNIFYGQNGKLNFGYKVFWVFDFPTLIFYANWENAFASEHLQFLF